MAGGNSGDKDQGSENLRPTRNQYTRLLERRKTIFSQISHYHKSIMEAEEIEFNVAEVKKDKITSLSAEFKTCLDSIENHESYQINETILAENCKYEDMLLTSLGKLRSFISSRYELDGSLVHEVTMSGGFKSEIKLVNLDVTDFYGDYLDWPSFRDIFNSLVHSNKSLTRDQKFQYLKKSLKGDARNLVIHLPSAEIYYDTAWQILVDRYHNKRALVNNYLEILTEQPKLISNSAKSIRSMIDTTNEALFGMKAFSVDSTHWDPIVVHLLSKKFDSETRVAFEQFLGGSKEVPTVEQIMTFLNTRFRILDEICKPTSGSKQPRDKVRVNHAETSGKSGRVVEPCSFCNGKHFIYYCSEFQKLRPEMREQVVKEKKLCFNCLSKHFSNECHSAYTCRHCRGKHNTLLHSSNLIGEIASSSGGLIEKINVHYASRNEYNSTLLATALVSVNDKYGNEHILRALIDQGSQATFITRSAIQLLELPQLTTSVSVSGVGKASEQINKCATIRIKSLIDSSFELDLSALIMQRISKMRSIQTLSNTNWPHLSGLKLADPQFLSYEKIDLLLGADIFGEIILPGLIKGEKGTPMAQNTKLGWILSGVIDANTANASLSAFSIQCNYAELTIDEQLEKFWKQEEVISNNKLSGTDENTIKMFKETYERESDGRYCVEMLFKQDSITKEDIGSSRSTAVARLLQMERKFERDTRFKQLYIDFMRDYLDSGHMALSCDSNTDEPVYHLPHHAVLRESSTTTKLRAVFDASAKSSTGYSLNDWQLIGPTVQQKLIR